MTLQEIINYEQEHRNETGAFGINACKRDIEWLKDRFGESYYEQLEKFVERANKDIFFNRAMVLACWELINEQ